MGRGGAFAQSIVFALAMVLLRVSNIDPNTRPFHPAAMIVITGIVLLLSLLIRLAHREPFNDVPNGPRWGIDRLSGPKEHPFSWGLRSYLSPYDWAVTFSLLVALVCLRHVDTPIISLAGSEPGALVGVQHGLIAGALIASYVYISTLVDLFYVHPRVRGGYWNGAVQCTSKDGAGNENAGKWESVTKVWLLHRWLTQVAIVFTLAVGLGLILHDLHVPVTNPIGGAAATVLGGLYVARVFPVFLFILNPSLSLGDSVELAEEYKVRRQFPLYFVVDVSLEGIKLFAYRFLAESDGTGLVSATQASGARPSAPVTAPPGQRQTTRGGDTKHANQTGTGASKGVAPQPAPAAHQSAVSAGSNPVLGPGIPGRTHDRILNPADATKLLRNRDSIKPCPSLNACTEINRYCPHVVKKQAGAGSPAVVTRSTYRRLVGLLLFGKRP